MPRMECCVGDAGPVGCHQESLNVLRWHVCGDRDRNGDCSTAVASSGSVHPCQNTQRCSHTAVVLAAVDPPLHRQRLLYQRRTIIQSTLSLVHLRQATQRCSHIAVVLVAMEPPPHRQRLLMQRCTIIQSTLSRVRLRQVARGVHCLVDPMVTYCRMVCPTRMYQPRKSCWHARLPLKLCMLLLCRNVASHLRSVPH